MPRPTVPPDGFITIYKDRDLALNNRDQLRDFGHLAEVFGPANSVLADADWDDKTPALSIPEGGGPYYVLIASLARLP